MFVTALLLYFAVSTGYNIGIIVLGATVLVDTMILATLQNLLEPVATATTKEQKFWEEDDDE